MIKLLDTFYFYYYLFYKKVIRESEPIATAVFVLSVVQSILINAVIEYTCVRIACTSMGKWPMISVTVILLILNYMYFIRSRRFELIIIREPSFFRNSNLSGVIVIIATVGIVSWIFWGAVLGRELLKDCM